MALAVCSGNVHRAASRLADMGMSVGSSTLHRWKSKHREKYESIRREVLPRIREEAAEDHTALSAANREAEAAVLARLIQEVPDLPARDLSTTGRNLAVAAGIHFDKAQVAAGMPSAIVEKRDATEILRQLKARGVGFMPHVEAALDATAEEISDEDKD